MLLVVNNTSTRKFAFPFSYDKLDWFFCCYRFLHSCLGLTAMKLTNHSRDTFACILSFMITAQLLHRMRDGKFSVLTFDIQLTWFLTRLSTNERSEFTIAILL